MQLFKRLRSRPLSKVGAMWRKPSLQLLPRVIYFYKKPDGVRNLLFWLWIYFNLCSFTFYNWRHLPDPWVVYKNLLELTILVPDTHIYSLVLLLILIHFWKALWKMHWPLEVRSFKGHFKIPSTKMTLTWLKLKVFQIFWM